MADKKHIFVFGLGYVGLHLAHQLSQRGWQITGTTRRPEQLTGRAPEHWRVLPFNADTPIDGLAEHLQQATHLLSSISALSGTDPVLELHAPELERFSGWTGYLSATSVYPHQPEGWVDEDTPPAPSTDRGKARLQAEQGWLATSQAEIFRLAGIYGPGRNPFADILARTARIIDKPNHYFNRIHQTDISRIIMAAMDKPQPRRVINCADNKPAPQGDVIRYAAELLGVEPPVPIRLEQANLSAMARSFYVSQRRIRSRVIGPEFKLDLMYPDYKRGLDAILETENHITS